MILAAGAFFDIAGDLRPVPSNAFLVGVAALALICGAVLPGVYEARFERKLQKEWYMTAHLRAAFHFMVESHNFSPLDLRLHYFVVKLRWNKGWPPIQRRLVRAAFFSIKTSAGLSSIEWKKGVGVVGKVWEDRDIGGRAENVQIAIPSSETAWATIPPAKRWNMTLQQATRMARTQVVFAIATREQLLHGDVVGVLSADTVIGDLAKFNDPGVTSFLRQAALAASQIWRK